jgi:nitroimidazol reductase NimA-like FMN-containing flavoprotein (pyridoxamine 5'-phosphate oxidase superfamily)
MTDADIEDLAEIQRQSYARAGATLRDAWPEETALQPGELRDLLETLVYGVLATSRPDGRAHATPIAFSFEEGAFWIATVPGVRLRNLRKHPWAALVLTEGQRDGRHRALTAEGPVALWEGGEFEATRGRLDAVWAARHGRPPDWATAFIQLRPERVLSYRDRGA